MSSLTTYRVGDSMLSPATVHGLPTEKLSPDEQLLLSFLYSFLPNSPVSTFRSLRCAAAAGKTDRVSRLPDNLLRRVVSLLPAKDGARTTVLSSRWRGIWRSAPTVLVDTHLLPAKCAGAASAALESHPGPFPFASLTCSFMTGRDSALLARWFQLLATKDVEELVFVNRPWPPSLRLPPPLFSCASLRQLWIGAWVFPDTAALPRRVAFPNLRLLFLGCVVMEHRDLEFLLAVSPLLEILKVTGIRTPLRARLTSLSLRCVQFCLSVMEEIAVVDAPSLERLFIWNRGFSDVRTRVKIGHAPKLSVLGYLKPGAHLLQIGNTIIKAGKMREQILEDLLPVVCVIDLCSFGGLKAGTKVSRHTTVPSVQMLAVQLLFAFDHEVKMLASFLRCFPSVETLVIQCRALWETIINLSLNMWQETRPIKCVRSHLKTLAFLELQGNRNEFDFLTFFAENDGA